MSLRVVISIKKNPEITKEMWKRIDKGMDDLIDAGFELSQTLVAVDEATLKKSGYVEKNYLNKKIAYDTSTEQSMASYVAGFTSGVGTTFNYALAIEYGTRPHWPPIAPLAAWAKRVLAVSDKEAYNVGYMIARKIAREGTEPQPYLRPAKDLMAARAASIIKKRTMK